MSPLALSDSLAALSGQPDECPSCHTVSHITRGLCLACLLRAGAEETENLSGEEFERALDGVAVADAQWRIGNYEILEEIGRGGMGVIYRARQRHSRRIVALKRILSYHADSRETLARFRREAQAASSLDHPNILPIYEVSESGEGVPFFSMKFASGGSLQDVAAALRDDPREIVRLMAKVVRAVQYAHRQGILHRDLKPGNILLDGRGEPLVSDFGLAKWLDTSSDLTRTLTIFGTPGYIAPEQADGRAAAITPAADVYSLGAILFDLLAGRPPFLGEHALAVIRQAGEKPAPKLRALIKHANKDLETICARCLERDPPARYRSAGNLAEDLERWLEGRPIVARPVSAPTKAWRWARRNPALAASVAGIFLLISLAVVRQFNTRRLAATVYEAELHQHSIAVLPFLDLDTAQPDEQLALAIGKSLQTILPQVGPARVTPVLKSNPFWADTASVADLRAANQSINARTILTGSKRSVRGNHRISLRLLSATTGDTLLTHSFEMIPTASLADSIHPVAASIYEILDKDDWSDVTLAGRDPGLRDDAAREFITSGRQLMFRDSPEDLDRSLRCLEKAIELEPRSAIAHAYFSATAAGRIHFQWDPQLWARGKKEAEQALLIEPGLPDGHRSLAGCYYQTGELSKAAEEQFRAVETGGPEAVIGNFIAITLEQSGHPSRAIDWLKIARRWTSQPGDKDANIGDCLSDLEEDKEAEEAYRRALELRPEEADGWIGLCHLSLLTHKTQEAHSLCQANRETFNRDNPSDSRPDEIAAQLEFFTRNYGQAQHLYESLAQRDPGNGADFYGAVTYDSAIGRLQQLQGRESAGMETLQKARKAQLNSRVGMRTAASLYCLSAIDASLGNTALALKEFANAINAGWTDARSPELDPRFDAIAHGAEFRRLLSDLKTRLSGMHEKQFAENSRTKGEESSP